MQKEVTIKKQWFISSRKGKLEDYYDVDLKKKNLLGSGAFGDVLIGQVKQGKTKRAIKQINKKKVKDPRQFAEEISIMRELDHPNIIKLFETFEDSKFVYLVMELCEGGELFDKIIEKGSLTEGQARYYFKQMISAVNYLHSKQIVHRDLKPENFLLLDKTENSPLKMIDFGMSVMFTKEMLKQSGGKMNMKLMVGTPYYISPEILKGNYDELCDIWSSGVILFILLSGVPPFFGNSDSDIMKMVKAEKFKFGDEFKVVSQDAMNLISRMLCKPDKRLSAPKILKDKWMQVDEKQFQVKPLNINVSNLKSFQNAVKLKKTMLTFIASQLNSSEISELGKIFNAMDKNNDGVLTIDEITKTLKENGKTNVEELENILRSLDTDQSGNINYTEFIAATIEKSVYMTEDKLFQAFKHFDIDKNGKISAEELYQIMGSHENFKDKNLAEYKKMIAEVDRNNDGEIDINEFIDMMTLL